MHVIHDLVSSMNTSFQNILLLSFEKKLPQALAETNIMTLTFDLNTCDALSLAGMFCTIHLDTILRETDRP